MFDAIRDRVMGMLRVPGEPHDPEGAGLLVFRAGEGYYRYRVAVFWLLRIIVLMVFAYVGFIAVLVATAVLAEPGGKRRGLFERVDPAALHTVLVVVGVTLGTLYLAQSVFSFAVMKLDYELRWYKVTDRSLRIREGVWFVREMTMSFANIQNVSIVQGPIQKALNVADLVVQSAGGGSGEQGRNLHVGYFRGIADAEKVRELILDRLRRHRDTGLGDHDDKHASGASMEDVLREVRDEARALHAAMERARGRALVGAAIERS